MAHKSDPPGFLHLCYWEFATTWQMHWKTAGQACAGCFPNPSCCTQYLDETKEIVFARLAC